MFFSYVAAKRLPSSLIAEDVIVRWPFIYLLFCSHFDSNWKVRFDSINIINALYIFSFETSFIRRNNHIGIHFADTHKVYIPYCQRREQGFHHTCKQLLVCFEGSHQCMGKTRHFANSSLCHFCAFWLGRIQWQIHKQCWLHQVKFYSLPFQFQKDESCFRPLLLCDFLLSSTDSSPWNSSSQSLRY